MCILNGISLYHTVLQLYSFSYLLHVVECHVLVEIYVIYLFLKESWVCELRSQVSVICQEQYSGGVAVQTANGIDSFRTCSLHEIHHRLALLRVIAGGHIVLRLVQKHIDFLL